MHTYIKYWDVFVSQIDILYSLAESPNSTGCDIAVQKKRFRRERKRWEK